MTSTSTLPAVQKNQGLQSDEPVWVRYSPHGELPLSSVTSFVIHGLVIGLACLAIWSASRFLDHPTRSLPIQTVQLAPGGGDRDRGVGPGGIGPNGSALEEIGPAKSDNPGGDTADHESSRPPLNPGASQRPPVVPEKGDKPTVQEGDRMAAFQALARQSGRMGRASDVGPRRGPRATDRSSPGPGPIGKPGRPMTKQEQRMARWAMVFDTKSGWDYLRQLASLGAVLAIPVKEGPGGIEYQVVKNANLLNPPARLVTEDLSRYKGIRWTDDDPKSVAQVMQTFGLARRPSHFVAFMPQQLEDRLAGLEKKFAGRAEDDIYETRFKVIRTGTDYIPVVIDQTPKSAAPAGR